MACGGLGPCHALVPFQCCRHEALCRLHQDARPRNPHHRDLCWDTFRNVGKYGKMGQNGCKCVIFGKLSGTMGIDHLQKGGRWWFSVLMGHRGWILDESAKVTPISSCQFAHFSTPCFNVRPLCVILLAIRAHHPRQKDRALGLLQRDRSPPPRPLLCGCSRVSKGAGRPPPLRNVPKDLPRVAS